VDDVAAERHAAILQLPHQVLQILHFERDRAARGRAGLVLNEMGQRQATAARQIVFHPVLVALIADRTGTQAQCVLVDVAGTRHVADGIHGERHVLQHGRLLSMSAVGDGKPSMNM